MYLQFVPGLEVCNWIFQVSNDFLLMFGGILANMNSDSLKVCTMDGRLSALGWKAANSIRQQLKLTPGVAENLPPDMNEINSNI